MSKPITFKRSTVEIGGCLFLILLVVAFFSLSYYIFFYTPEIKNEPYVDPQEANK